MSVSTSEECRYCKKSFKSPTTLSVHMCVKKRRHVDSNLPSSRIGLLAFQRFYELTTNSKKTKSLDDFIDSSFYLDFVKFGHHIVNLHPISTDQFIDFIIRNSVKLKDWTKDYVYEQYVNDLIKKEPADHAVERSINEMAEWAKNHSIEITDFFNAISPNEAAFLIQRGKLSPWVLYLAETADTLMKSFNEDHAKMISDMIDPVFWQKKFAANNDDVVFISDVLCKSGL